MILSRFRIAGHSMVPTFSPGQTVLVSSLPYVFSQPKVGDVVVYSTDRKHIFIKRIAGVKSNKYFVLGDNYVDSLDSRQLGAIQRQAILGKVVLSQQ